jgi:hypothetical protein
MRPITLDTAESKGIEALMFGWQGGATHGINQPRKRENGKRRQNRLTFKFDNRNGSICQIKNSLSA